MTVENLPSMLPGGRCNKCLKAMERVSETSWMCVPCRRSVHWFEAVPEIEPADYDMAHLLQREWE